MRGQITEQGYKMKIQLRWRKMPPEDDVVAPKASHFQWRLWKGGHGYFDGWGHRGGVMGIFGARRIYEA